MEYRYKLGFIGAGNMAKAIASGIVSANLLTSKDLIMSCTSNKDPFMGIKITNDNNEVLINCEYIVLAVKPQIFNSIIDTFSISNAKYVISIMAGVKSSKIANSFNKDSKIIRVMPNTPVAVGKGMVGIANNDAGAEANDFVKQIFDSTGKSIFVDESLFDAVTSISGSGPAYVYYFIKSMIDAGIKGGLSEGDAKALTLQTFVGACSMVEKSTDDIGLLIQKVCSKGGTTIQAIDTFNNYDLESKIVEGIDKCRQRSEELSK